MDQSLWAEPDEHIRAREAGREKRQTFLKNVLAQMVGTVLGGVVLVQSHEKRLARNLEQTLKGRSGEEMRRMLSSGGTGPPNSIWMRLDSELREEAEQKMQRAGEE